MKHYHRMSQSTPLDLLCSSHVSALIEVIRADSYALGVHSNDLNSMCLSAVTLAMHRLSQNCNYALLEGHPRAQRDAIRLVLDETSSLLAIGPIVVCDVSADLRLLERLCVLVLDELGLYDDEETDPF